MEWRSNLARRLRDAGCAIEDTGAWINVGGFQLPLEERFAQYEAEDRQFGYLLDKEELDQARRSGEVLTAGLNAFCLISSMQEGHDMAYWIGVNRSSRRSAILLAEFLINSPLDHGRPRFRAARALELFDRNLRELAVEAAENAGGPAELPVNRLLLDAIRSVAVESFARKTDLVKSEESRSLLLLEFQRLPQAMQVRLET